MSASTEIVDPPQLDDEDGPLEEVEVAEAASRVNGPTRRGLGLKLAPLGILALIGLLYLYYSSLDLDPVKNIQQASALGWSDKLQPQLVEHLLISFLSTALVIVIAVPLGILITRDRVRRFAPAIIGVANSGQALPAYGLLVIFLAITGQGLRTVVIALTLYALLPVLRNTMVGLDGVDRSVIEAGRGMGLTRRGVLAKIELPLAVPVILAGVRTAMILNIGMATLAFLVGGGGLGITISSGLKLQQDSVLLIGSGMVAIVALTFDWLGAVAERYLRPKGV